MKPPGSSRAGAGRQEPWPRILAERRVEEDHVEIPPFPRDERPRVADVGLERARAKSGGGRAQRVDQRPAAVDGDREGGATGGRLERQRAGPRVKIEAALPGQGLPQPVEQRFPDAVRRRAQALGRREPDHPPAPCAADDANADLRRAAARRRRIGIGLTDAHYDPARRARKVNSGHCRRCASAFLRSRHPHVRPLQAKIRPGGQPPLGRAARRGPRAVARKARRRPWRRVRPPQARRRDAGGARDRAHHRGRGHRRHAASAERPVRAVESRRRRRRSEGAAQGGAGRTARARWNSRSSSARRGRS